MRILHLSVGFITLSLKDEVMSVSNGTYRDTYRGYGFQFTGQVGSTSMPVLILSIRSVSYRNQQYSWGDMRHKYKISVHSIGRWSKSSRILPPSSFSDTEKSCIILNHVPIYLLAIKKASLTRHNCFLKFSFKSLIVHSFYTKPTNKSM